MAKQYTAAVGQGRAVTVSLGPVGARVRGRGGLIGLTKLLSGWQPSGGGGGSGLAVEVSDGRVLWHLEKNRPTN